MANWRHIISTLRKQEKRLAAQLASIRGAIASLEFGSSGVPAPAVIDTPHAVRVGRPKRRRRKVSGAARARMAAAQRRRGAKVRAEGKS